MLTMWPHECLKSEIPCSTVSLFVNEQKRMLTCLFSEEQCMMSNQVGVKTCRDNNEHAATEAG